MCRLAAFTGTEIALSRPLFDAPHSLQEQSYRPREMVFGTVNVDGTGVAWWDRATEPLRYVTAAAPWQDANLPGLARRLSSGTILAAVRSATPGIPLGPANVAPFVVGDLAAVHNGFIAGFGGAPGRELIASLPDGVYEHLETMNDSKALFLKVVQHYDGGTLERAVRNALSEVGELARRHGAMATLNLVVARRGEVVAARHSVDGPLNSLYTATTEEGHWIVSEPLDETTAWEPVPDHHLVTITPHQISVSRLETI